MEVLNKELQDKMKQFGFTTYSLSKELTRILGRQIKPNTIMYLIRSTNYPTKDICEAVCSALDDLPENLFQMVRKSHEEILDIDLLDEPILPPDEMIIKREEKTCLKKALKALNEKERFAILRYFNFICRQGGWTYELIGEEMGRIFPEQSSSHVAGSPYTRERVRQIAYRALKKMRANFSRMGIK